MKQLLEWGAFVDVNDRVRVESQNSMTIVLPKIASIPHLHKTAEISHYSPEFYFGHVSELRIT